MFHLGCWIHLHVFVCVCFHTGMCSSVISNVKKNIWICYSLKWKSPQAVPNCTSLFWMNKQVNSAPIQNSRTWKASMSWCWSRRDTWMNAAGEASAIQECPVEISPSSGCHWAEDTPLAHQDTACPVFKAAAYLLFSWEKTAKAGTSYYL